MYNDLMLLLMIIIVLIPVILLFAGNYFYNFAILRRKKEFLDNDPDLRETTSGASWDTKKEWLQEQKQEELTIESFDNLKLNALYIPCATPSNKTVILVHGYNSWNGAMGGFAQYYSETLSFNVLMPNLRGHGKSEGSYIGFGWHDRKDILQWIDVIIEKLGHDTQIVLHGVSMGAATVLMTSGENLPGNVKCIISDCAYSSVADILGYQVKRMFKLPKFPLIYFTSLVCKVKAGYYIGEASALKQVHHSKLPILFIHGSVDKFVPTKMVYELYDAALCPKELIVVEDAAHGTSFWKDPEIYKTAVKEFLQNYIYRD
jgi:fermentation-respiration switch protein FrsA (DUF1100 family)